MHVEHGVAGSQPAPQASGILVLIAFVWPIEGALSSCFGCCLGFALIFPAPSSLLFLSAERNASRRQWGEMQSAGTYQSQRRWPTSPRNWARHTAGSVTRDQARRSWSFRSETMLQSSKTSMCHKDTHMPQAKQLIRGFFHVSQLLGRLGVRTSRRACQAAPAKRGRSCRAAEREVAPHALSNARTMAVQDTRMNEHAHLRP